MNEEQRQAVREHLYDALWEMTEPLFAKGKLDRVEDLENSLAFGEVHGVLMHLTTLLFETGLALPKPVYHHIAEAGQMLNAEGSNHRLWTWERLKPQCVSGSA